MIPNWRIKQKSPRASLVTEKSAIVRTVRKETCDSTTQTTTLSCTRVKCGKEKESGQNSIHFMSLGQTIQIEQRSEKKCNRTEMCSNPIFVAISRTISSCFEKVTTRKQKRQEMKPLRDQILCWLSHKIQTRLRVQQHWNVEAVPKASWFVSTKSYSEQLLSMFRAQTLVCRTFTFDVETLVIIWSTSLNESATCTCMNQK